MGGIWSVFALPPSLFELRRTRRASTRQVPAEPKRLGAKAGAAGGIRTRGLRGEGPGSWPLDDGSVWDDVRLTAHGNAISDAGLSVMALVRRVATLWLHV